jgi:hypothetical protein
MSKGTRIKTAKSLAKTTTASNFWMLRRRTKSSSLLASKSSGRKGPKGTTCKIIKRVIQDKEDVIPRGARGKGKGDMRLRKNPKLSLSGYVDVSADGSWR